MSYQQRRVGTVDLIEVAGDPKRETILLLHGFGADASDLAPISSLFREANWIFPQGPLSIPFSAHYTGRAWFPVNIPLLTQVVREQRFDEVAQAFPSHLDEARKLIDTLIIDLNIPRSQLVIGGFSQGAILAVETALKGSDRMAGLLIFSGTLVNAPNWKKMAPHHARTPFFQSHGSHDQLLPLKKAEELAHLLKEGGLIGELHTFSGGHDIPHSIITKLISFLHSSYPKP